MKVKEYKTFKTAAKTAKENNLVFKDKENLFDFSLLDSMEISEREKEYIKTHDIRYVNAAFKESFYGTEFDNFSACVGKHYIIYRKYILKKVESLYIESLRFQKIEHNTQERTHVYDNYTVTTYRTSDGYMEPNFDIEL